jgi:hypothetical protein
MEGQPPDMEGTWDYTENAASYRQKGGGLSAWGLGVGLITLHRKNKVVRDCLQEHRTWTDFFG